MRAVPMSIHSLHARFLLLLPRIKAHAKIYFRDIRCAANRADQVAETVALAWKWFVRLDKRGKDASQFVTTFATFAARAVRCGRRVAGVSRAKDVMSRHTQKRHDFVVEKSPDFSTLTEALADNTVVRWSTPTHYLWPALIVVPVVSSCRITPYRAIARSAIRRRMESRAEMLTSLQACCRSATCSIVARPSGSRFSVSTPYKPSKGRSSESSIAEKSEELFSSCPKASKSALYSSIS